jgi:hypothetical protein
MIDGMIRISPAWFRMFRAFPLSCSVSTHRTPMASEFCGELSHSILLRNYPPTYLNFKTTLGVSMPQARS